MALRFCTLPKDFENKELGKSLVMDSSFFLKAHELFYQYSSLMYIPVKDRKGNILCYCYQDFDQEKMLENVMELLTFQEVPNFLDGIKDKRRICIWGFSEIAYYFSVFLDKQEIDFEVAGDLWQFLYPEKRLNDRTSDDEFLNLFFEGNYGLPFAEGAYGRTVLEWFAEDVEPVFRFYRSICEYENVLSFRECQKALSKKIDSGTPFMLARIGNTELSILKEYLEKKNGLIVHYSPFWLDYLYDCCGFFSDQKSKFNETDVDNYAQLTLEALCNCDVNVCWGNEELAAGLSFILKEYEKGDALRVSWDYFETAACCYSSSSRKNALMGKKVLVISPFTHTIITQYSQKEIIHNGEDVFPDCEMIYYNAFETQMGETLGFINWFEAFHKLCEDIQIIDFDVALIGAGSYGFPLAYKIKQMGKTAMSLSSYLPNWFGIKMKRYCAYVPINRKWNKNWVFPNEKPPVGYEKIEDGCYWR